MFVYEELLLKDKEVFIYSKIEVIDMIGWEGIWGMIFSFIIFKSLTLHSYSTLIISDLSVARGAVEKYLCYKASLAVIRLSGLRVNIFVIRSIVGSSI